MAININRGANVFMSRGASVDVFGKEGGYLRMKFTNGTVPASPYDINSWNSYFDLPNNGTPFDTVTVDFNAGTSIYDITLLGGKNIHIQDGLFNGGSDYLSYIEGTAVTSIGSSVFTTNLNTLDVIDLPNVTSVGLLSFLSLSAGTLYLNLPSCTSLDNNSGNIFIAAYWTGGTAIFNSYLATNNTGGPDNSILNFITNNPSVTITYV